MRLEKGDRRAQELLVVITVPDKVLLLVIWLGRQGPPVGSTYHELRIKFISTSARVVIWFYGGRLDTTFAESSQFGDKNISTEKKVRIFLLNPPRRRRRRRRHCSPPPPPDPHRRLFVHCHREHRRLIIPRVSP